MKILIKKIIVFATIISMMFGSMIVNTFADEPTQEELLAQYYAALAAMTEDEQAALAAKQAEIVAQDNMVYLQLMALKEKFPDGMKWGMEKIYISANKGRMLGGLQHACGAFAVRLQDIVFGTGRKVKVKKTNILSLVNGTYSMHLTYYPQTGQYGAWELDGYNGDNAQINMNFEKIWNELRVGDVVADLNHAVIVLSKTPDSITVAEGNNDGKVRWGRRILKESLRKGLQIVETMY